MSFVISANVELICDCKCRGQHECMISTNVSSYNAESAKREARQIGWKIGKGKAGSAVVLCPNCHDATRT